MAKLMNKGAVEQPAFTAEIPFEMRLGLVVIKVNINGKDYDFMVDTGAPNVITEELAAELKLQPALQQKTGDSQGKKESLNFVEMPEMLIGGIHFIETGAAVADLKRSNVIACLDVDGFVGANLMKSAIWQFDYERKIITISDTIASFDIPANAIRIPFVQAGTHTPKIDISYDSIMDKNVTFDTGSNGYFSTSQAIYSKLNQQGKITQPVVSFGANNSGLYGLEGVDSSYSATVEKTTLGNLTIPNQVVSFDHGARTLGTKFLKHYRVIVNWFTNEISLIPTDDFVNTTFEHFGMTPMYTGEKLEVRMVIIGSDADKKGIRIGDQILEVNGENFGNFSTDQWCEMLNNGLVPEADQQVTLVLLHDGVEREVVVEKLNLMKTN